MRLERAQRTVGSSALRIKHALGSMLELAGVPTHANQPLWRRLDAFASADLKGVISADAQADISRHLHDLSALHARVADVRWEAVAASESPDHETVTGHGGDGTITTTVSAIELLAELVTTVAGALEYINTRLTAQIMFGDAAIPGSVRAYVRDIRATVERMATEPDLAWTRESRLGS